MPSLPLPGVRDPEGARIPSSLPPVVDAHVHLFPDVIFKAIVDWFDRFGWPIRYRFNSGQVIEFLQSRGIRRVVGLHYSHKPGVARWLNSYMAELCSQHHSVTGTATVFPGEEDARGILEEAFRSGLSAVKLHAHVQGFHMDSEEMQAIYEVCQLHGKPLVMHVTREPRNPDFPYPCDPYVCCRADKLEQVLRDYPKLRICVPHLGLDEFEAYQELLEKYDNLWTDTTMVLADYLPTRRPPLLSEMRIDRIMYGTDFPNIPYAWDREIKKLCEQRLSEEQLELILAKNAMEFFSMPR